MLLFANVTCKRGPCGICFNVNRYTYLVKVLCIDCLTYSQGTPLATCAGSKTRTSSLPLIIPDVHIPIPVPGFHVADGEHGPSSLFAFQEFVFIFVQVVQ